jgi:hypothetical protein
VITNLVRSLAATTLHWVVEDLVQIVAWSVDYDSRLSYFAATTTDASQPWITKLQLATLPSVCTSEQLSPTVDQFTVGRYPPANIQMNI